MKRYLLMITTWLFVALALSACGEQAIVSEGGGSKTVVIGADGQIITAGDADGGAVFPIEGPPVSNAPTDNVLVMEGELETVEPELKLAFPADVRGMLISIAVQAGQMVRQGDLIATLDDAELQQAVADARLALDRAEQDQTRERQKREAQYRQELEAAEKQFAAAQADAEIALRNARSALTQAQLKPPALALRQARVRLAQAQDNEAAAADNYKQALDRPWEPQRVRDGMYKEWQRCITERELAEMEWQDAQLDAQIYDLGLADREQAVADAQAKLDGLERKTIELDTDYTSHDRAVADARAKLQEAQQRLAQANLYAPRDGMITAINAAIGATIGGETPVATLLDVSALCFVARNLSEQHIAQLEQGQDAALTLRSYPDQVLNGYVTTVLPNSSGNPDESRFVVHIRLVPNELCLLPGMTGRAEIALSP